MRVKLRSEKEILKMGYMVQHEMGYSDDAKMISLIDPGTDMCVVLDLNRVHNMGVVPKNSITEEVYNAFKNCFEVIDEKLN